MKESHPSVDAEEALDVLDAPGSTQVDWLGEGDPGEQTLQREFQELERRGLERRADNCQP